MPWVIDSKLKVETTLLQKVVVNGKEIYKVNCVDKSGVTHTVFYKHWESGSGGGGGSGADAETKEAVANGSLAFGIINEPTTEELTTNYSVLEFSASEYSNLSSAYNFNRTTADGGEEEVDVAQMILDYFCCIMQNGYSKLDGIQSVLTEACDDGSFSQIVEQYELGTKITQWINTWIQEQTDAGTYTEAAYQEFISTTTEGGVTTLKDKMNNDENFKQARQDFMTNIAGKLGITVEQLQNGNW